MPVLKDLVPGSKSDRLSFHSDNFSLSEDQQHESMEEGTVPTRPSRGFTPSQHVEPKRTTPSNRLGDPAQVRSKVEQKSGTENGKEERQERPSWFTAIISLFSTIINYLWSKGKRIFKEEVSIDKRFQKVWNYFLSGGDSGTLERSFCKNEGCVEEGEDQHSQGQLQQRLQSVSSLTFISVGLSTHDYHLQQTAVLAKVIQAKIWLIYGNFDLWVEWAIIFQCTKSTKIP